MTATQKQCLLCYLGYYTGAIDGIFGAQSTAATKAFQSASGLEADGIFGPLTEAAARQAVSGRGKSFWEDIEYFTREEFRCKCGGKYCDGFPAEPQQTLLRLADAVRSRFGAPATVSSGVRCAAHNANVGGVAGSRHLSGKAMDFCVAGKTAAQVLSFAKTLPGVNYAYAIDGSYIHMDVE